MSKPQEHSPLREWLVTIARSCTLTRQEQAMVAAILLSMLAGAVVMHCRREYRLSHPAEGAPTPHRARKSFDDR